MNGRTRIILLLAMLPVIAGPLSALADGTVSIDSALWDRAVNSLLAAGMYGIDLSADSTATLLHLQRGDALVMGLAPDDARFSGHAITFSYKGSSGLLGFSAGYIYTSKRAPDMGGALPAGLDGPGQQSIDPADDWFMAIGLSGAYKVHDDLAIGLGGRTMLMKNPRDTKHGRMLSFLLNMPMSYRNFITITPELQWSHSLSDTPLSTGGGRNKASQDPTQDIFYGGVSVTFSY